MNVESPGGTPDQPGAGGPPPPPPAPAESPGQAPAMGQPGGAMAPAGGGGIQTHESVVEWLLCIFIPFYSLYWIHRSSKEMQEWSGGRIDYNAGSTIAALTIGYFILVPPFVAIFSFGGRVRRAQELGGVEPRASGIGFFGRLFLPGYGYKWIQDQLNELAVRPAQG